jgi:hypothetical protein
MRKVGILGRCDNTRKEAPTHDKSWEMWGLAWDMAFVGARHYEIHTPPSWTNGTISDRMNYPDWLQSIADCNGEDLWLQDTYIENAKVFPLDDIRKIPYLCLPGTNEPYLESSIAWMIVHAFLEKIEKIGIWGVDLTAEDEWAYQRPNMAYLIGVCRAKGMRILIPEACALYELKELDSQTLDFCDPDIPRHHLEYKLAFERVKGLEPKRRKDLLTSCFKEPPRYGYCAIPITEYLSKGVAAE